MIMDKALTILALLAVLALLVAVAPVAIAAAIGWTPEQTNSLMTGGMAVCGGAVGLCALAAGLAFGLALGRDKRHEREERSASYAVSAPAAARSSDLEYWRAERARIDAQQAALRLEQARRALEPAQTTPAADMWQQATPRWIDVTASQEGLEWPGFGD